MAGDYLVLFVLKPAKFFMKRAKENKCCRLYTFIAAVYGAICGYRREDISGWGKLGLGRRVKTWLAK